MLLRPVTNCLSHAPESNTLVTVTQWLPSVPGHNPRVDLAELQTRQRLALWLDGRTGLQSVGDAMQFIRDVAIALRYGAASNLPVASMYRATQRQVPSPEEEKSAHARAFELTNGLLASGQVVEINLIANRLCLAYESVMPAVYALRRGHIEPQLSDSAQQAIEFIEANGSGTSGDVRRLLKVEGQPRPDAADLALGELQRELLVDRGPAGGPSTGVFYLTREGYPYRVFANSHPGIVESASRLARQQAADALLSQYLEAAVFATRRKLASLFQLLVSPDEIDAAVRSLTERGLVESLRVEKTDVIICRDRYT